MDKELCFTNDGSTTFYIPELKQHYHSLYGAVGEALHVFIDAGLLPLMEKQQHINILEVGLGTGLNALLTEVYSRSKSVVYYSAIEAFPLTKKEIEQLNYHKQLPNISHKIFLEIHNIPSDNHFHVIRENFHYKIIHAKLEQFCFDENMYDLVYFDAFSPDAQPELWELEVFEKIYNSMKKGGYLCTYSAKGMVRRRMEFAGFKVEKLAGFSGKREMLRGEKI